MREMVFYSEPFGAVHTLKRQTTRYMYAKDLNTSAALDFFNEETQSVIRKEKVYKLIS